MVLILQGYCEVIRNAIIAIIDGFTTIHSHRRSDSDRTSDAKCMCSVVIRVFQGIPAISICEGNTHLDPNIVLPDALANELTSDKYFIHYHLLMPLQRLMQ